MAEYLQVPDKNPRGTARPQPDRTRQEPPPPADGPYKIGYLARICPEKGFHLLVDAFQRLKEQPRVCLPAPRSRRLPQCIRQALLRRAGAKNPPLGASQLVHLSRRSRSPRKNPPAFFAPRLFRAFGLRRSQGSVGSRSLSQRHPGSPTRPRRVPRVDRGYRRRSPRHTPFPRTPSPTSLPPCCATKSGDASSDKPAKRRSTVASTPTPWPQGRSPCTSSICRHVFFRGLYS